MTGHVCQCLDVLMLGEVESMSFRRNTMCILEIASELSEFRCIGGGENEIAALPRQRFGDRLADASRGASDKGGAAL